MAATPLMVEGFSFEVVLWEPQGFFSRWQKARKAVLISQGEHNPSFDLDELRRVCSGEGIIESLGRADTYFLATRSVILEDSYAGDAIAGMSIDPSSVVFYAPGNKVIAMFDEESRAKILDWLNLV